MNTKQIIKEEVSNVSSQILQENDSDVEARLKAIYEKKEKIVNVLNSLDDFFASMEDLSDIDFVEAELSKIYNVLFSVTRKIPNHESA